ncbi:unnamed protein product [Medioppia subpectinata]|uniref:EF-hand domain-containing protein n=1 Tax=Medioppia subpectinata TaxID=1979941 RepID=A0A7R9KT52_9ACAR|nr:unnamed protein product [Medioppia subpectinata]CAG2108132.1 unnamed protein product [Medioppia subpectinata]
MKVVLTSSAKTQFQKSTPSSVADSLESATEEGVDFWNWVFADDVNTTDEHKPSSHLKDELEYHYGIKMDNKSPHLADEMDFHMFNLHDFDKNKFLDGLELLSMLDNHGSGHHSPQHTYPDFSLRQHLFSANLSVHPLAVITQIGDLFATLLPRIHTILLRNTHINR